MKNANFADAETSLFVQHCLVCPALLVHLSQPVGFISALFSSDAQWIQIHILHLSSIMDVELYLSY